MYSDCEYDGKEDTHNIKLTFPQFQNQNELLNFIPFIYDQQRSPEKSKLLVFDIIQQRIGTEEQIGPQTKLTKYMVIDSLGFHKF